MNSEKNPKPRGKHTLLFRLTLILILVFSLLLSAPNIWIILGTHKRIGKIENQAFAAQLEGQTWQAILVLGAGIRQGQPSPMLRERLDCAVELYRRGYAPKIIMSGDHREDNYNEVAVMLQYAVDAGVPPEDIFLDHSGLNTYRSLYRAKHLFSAEKLIVVTQRYHLYRAVYLADRLGIETYGAAADQERRSGQLLRDLREILARDKDFVLGIYLPDQPVTEESIALSGDGRSTH